MEPLRGQGAKGPMPPANKLNVKFRVYSDLSLSCWQSHHLKSAQEGFHLPGMLHQYYCYNGLVWSCVVY